MMKRTILVCLILACAVFQSSTPVPLWGKTGHRAVGAIAETYLTSSAKRQIERLTNSASLAFMSTYADEIKSDPRYADFYTWHYINMPLDQTYQQSEKNAKGDLVTGIAFCKKIIKDPNASDADKVFYLKLLIHLIGDLHQPLHVGLAEDRGGNDFKVQWQFKDTNLHSVWDSKMIDDYGMGYTELASNRDHLTKEQIKEIQKGTIEDWVHETQQLANHVYASANEGDNLRNEYSYLHFNTVRSQLQKGGIRLAKVLNDLF